MTLARPFYTESNDRWSRMAVDHATLADAEQVAQLISQHDQCSVKVYDCTGGPVGKLVCSYHRGVRS